MPDHDDLDYSDGLYLYQGVPFTGTAYKTLSGCVPVEYQNGVRVDLTKEKSISNDAIPEATAPKLIIPQPGDWFKADDPQIGMLVFGVCLRDIDDHSIYARCFSQLAPDGESGTYPVANVIEIISEAAFQEAMNNGWQS